MSYSVLSFRVMSTAIHKSLYRKQIIYHTLCKSHRLYHGIVCSDQFVEKQLAIKEHYLRLRSSNLYGLDFRPFLISCSLTFKACYSKDSKSQSNKTSPNKENDSVKPKKPKKELKIYITLLGVDNSICVSTVEEAKKIAERRGLKLVKVVDFDPKSSRAVYKLVTESQYLKDDWGDPQNVKEKSDNHEKLVSLSSNINKNDVLTKLNMIKKWLSKQIEIRVVVTGDTRSGFHLITGTFTKKNKENIYNFIEKGLKNEGVIVQKKVKGSAIRFQINPPKKSEDKTVEKIDK